MGDNIPQRVPGRRREVLRFLLLPTAMLLLCCCGPGCGCHDKTPRPVLQPSDREQLKRLAEFFLKTVGQRGSREALESIVSGRVDDAGMHGRVVSDLASGDYLDYIEVVRLAGSVKRKSVHGEEIFEAAWHVRVGGTLAKEPLVISYCRTRGQPEVGPQSKGFPGFQVHGIGGVSFAEQMRAGKGLLDLHWQGGCETFLLMHPAQTGDVLQRVDILIRGSDVPGTRAPVYEIRGEDAVIRTEAELRDKLLAYRQIAGPEASVLLHVSRPLLWRWVPRAVEIARRAGFRHVALLGDGTVIPVDVVRAPAIPMSPVRKGGPSGNVIVVRGMTGEQRGSHRRLDGLIIDGKRIPRRGDSDPWESLKRRMTELKKAGRKDLSVRIAFHPEIRCRDVWPVADVFVGIGREYVGGFYGKSMDRESRHVVYVIDRSGSMVTVFDYIRLQMLLSIGDLSREQDFHIILFADEKTIEGPSNGLVKATPDNKVAVVDFLERDEVRPRGKTTALVALKRAFEVLDNAGDRKGKLILLLTDGEFAGIGGGSRYKGKVGNEAVLNWLADNNKDKRVTIKTYLYTDGTSARAKHVMNKIAKDHGGGRAKLIGPDD